MIYITLNKNNEVAFMHSMPFDKKHGLGKTKEKLEEEGFFVDNIPDAEEKMGKTHKLFGDANTKELWYEYEDRPLTDQEELTLLKQSQKEQDQLIMELLLR